MHAHHSGTDERIDRHLTKKARQWLAKPNRIPAEQAALAAQVLGSYRPQPVTVVASHGDFSARNWIQDDGRVAVIDFGRFGYRPAVLDFLRMAGRQWRIFPDTRAAFVDGYGRDPAMEDPGYWAISELRESVATACWAHQVGDEAFEREGLVRLSQVLKMFA